MRDPKRIDVIIQGIRDLWKKNPQLRFGQLIANAVSEDALYFIEDARLLESLKRFYTADKTSN